MKYIQFSNEEKIALFDEISGHFYEANFGQMSKSDIELMMFRFYIEKMVADNTNEDGTIDYQKCSDYKISRELGITQQRVRNLKVKNQLIHPIDYDWKRALARLTENARFDKETRKVTLNIPDPNLYLEIQNFIEEQGAYVEKQLNSKILQLRAEYYIDLVISLEATENRKKIIRLLKKHFKDNNHDENSFDEKNIGKSLVAISTDLTTIVSNLSTVVSPENYLAKALFGFLKSKLS